MGQFWIGVDTLGQMVCSACGQAIEARHTYDGLGMRVRSIEKSINTYFVYGQSGQMLLEVTPQTAQNEYQQKEYYYVVMFFCSLLINFSFFVIIIFLGVINDQKFF